MTNVFDVAEYILGRFESSSAIKLQKLVYYSQAWNLVAQAKPLFREPIIAYQYGPLTTTLWEQHRGQKTLRAGQFAALADGNLSRFDKIVIDSVLDVYGPMSMTSLVDRTHREQPWIEASKVGGEITPDSMMAFYIAEKRAGGLAPSVTVAGQKTVARVSGQMDEEPDDFSAFLRALRESD